jgi:hypothetical protein
LKKIVIIGGSHSGFSSAWLLINGTAAYNSAYASSIDSGAEGYKPQAKAPDAVIKFNENCTICCKCASITYIRPSMYKRFAFNNPLKESESKCRINFLLYSLKR